MEVVFIGSGNVATHLAMALKGAGNTIVQVCSRTLENASALACKVDAEPIDNTGDIYRAAALYVFCLKDDVLPAIAARMPPTTGIWAHTAGSLPLAALSPHKERGVLYPLQTFSRERKVDFRDVPLFIEGEGSGTAALLKGVAETISGNVRFLSGDKRRVLHLAAVFACNFTNHMYTLASEIMGQVGIPFHLLNPLIAETAAKAAVMDPKTAQTGPAVRSDEEVMRKHLELLDDPLKREIYSLLSESIRRSSAGQ